MQTNREQTQKELQSQELIFMTVVIFKNIDKLLGFQNNIR